MKVKGFRQTDDGNWEVLILIVMEDTHEGQSRRI